MILYSYYEMLHHQTKKKPQTFSYRAENSLITRKDISRFSPPQMSMPLSYCPSSLKYSRSMANSPPAMVGDLKTYMQGSSFSFRERKKTHNSNF